MCWKLVLLFGVAFPDSFPFSCHPFFCFKMFKNHRMSIIFYRKRKFSCLFNQICCNPLIISTWADAWVKLDAQWGLICDFFLSQMSTKSRCDLPAIFCSAQWGDLFGRWSLSMSFRAQLCRDRDEMYQNSRRLSTLLEEVLKSFESRSICGTKKGFASLYCMTLFSEKLRNVMEDYEIFSMKLIVSQKNSIRNPTLIKSLRCSLSCLGNHLRNLRKLLFQWEKWSLITHFQDVSLFFIFFFLKHST